MFLSFLAKAQSSQRISFLWLFNPPPGCSRFFGSMNVSYFNNMKLSFLTAKIQKLALAVLVLVIVSCQSEIEIPETVIRQEQMIEILIDVHLAEAWKERRKMEEDSALIFIKAQYETIFKLHNITRSEFENSLEYYENHPDIMDELYHEVINEMSRREAGLKATARQEVAE